MKYKLNILLTLVFVLTSIISKSSYLYDINSYQKSKISPKKDKLPETIEECFDILNKTLDKKTIEEFKNEEIKVAVIQIARIKGEDYIDNWNLDFRRKSNSYYLNDNMPKLLLFFEENGIYNPKLIIRVIFSLYHSYLHNKKYNVDDEISNIINVYKTSQKSSQKKNHHYYYYRQWEDSLLRLSYFKKFNSGNIIGTWYKEKNRWSEFYLSGKVIDKKDSSDCLMIKLFDIVSDKRYNCVIMNNDTITVGDTISYSNLTWHKYLSEYYDPYYKKHMPSLPNWQKYISKKYPNIQHKQSQLNK